jgi:hypothetical protein
LAALGPSYITVQYTDGLRRQLLMVLACSREWRIQRLTLNDQKCAFSEAWLQAIAAAAGFGYQPGTRPDDQSVDMTISKRTSNGLTRNPRLDVQLKCTSEDSGVEDPIDFWLKLKNYDDLRADNVSVPAILVVLYVPDSPEDWLLQNANVLEMYHCAWWASLRGLGPSKFDTGEHVLIPRTQRLNRDSLSDIMNRLEQGLLP